MRKTKEFNEWLLKFEATPLVSGLRPQVFQVMRKKAKSFSDWTAIFQYGGNDIRYEALNMMKKTVLKGKNSADIQLNILELFFVIDQDEKDEILRKYLKKHHGKDDLLFVLENSDWDGGNLKGEVLSKLGGFYKRCGNIDRGLDARCKRTCKLLKKTTFNPWGFACKSKGFTFDFLNFKFSYQLYLKEHLQQGLVIHKLLLLFPFRVHYFYFCMK